MLPLPFARRICSRKQILHGPGSFGRVQVYEVCYSAYGPYTIAALFRRGWREQNQKRDVCPCDFNPIAPPTQRPAPAKRAPRAIASPKKKPRPVHAVWIDEWSASAVLWRHPHRQQQARAPGSLAVLRRRCCSCNWSRVHSSSPSPSCRSHHQRRRSCRGHSSHQQLLAPHASKPLRPSVDLKPPRKAAGVMALSEAAIAGTASLLRRRHCRLQKTSLRAALPLLLHLGIIWLKKLPLRPTVLRAVS